MSVAIPLTTSFPLNYFTKFTACQSYLLYSIALHNIVLSLSYMCVGSIPETDVPLFECVG